MIAEVASRIPDGAVTTQSTRQLRPEPEATLYRPLREEELMQLQTTDQLLPHIQSVVRNRFPNRMQQLMGAVDIAITHFDGHKPRRDGTEAALHPVRTLYRALIADPDLTPVHGAVLALHDTIEDCNVTQRDLEEMLRMRDQKFSDEEIKNIALGANQLSRIQNGQKLFPQEYLQQLTYTDERNPDLRIVAAKTWDTIDNTKNDIWMLINDPLKIDPQRVLTFLAEKAEDVLTLARQNDLNAVSTNMLTAAMLTSEDLAKREFEIRELRTRENETREAEVRRRQMPQRRTLPTARVPALSPTH